MITAISEATVPKLCVVVRKAYGAGLYAMAGPGFDPDATIACRRRIAVMGGGGGRQRRLCQQDRGARTEEQADEVHPADARGLRAGHRRDAAGLRLVVDAVIEPEDLRAEIVTRIARARTRTGSSPTAGTGGRPAGR